MESAVGVSCVESGARRSVLVVEDHGPTRQAIRVLLRHSGYDSEVAVGGRQALDCFLRQRPQLALVDLGLPDMDGVEVIRTMVGQAPGVPVLVLSGATAPERVVAAVRAGAAGYLFKEELGTRLAPAVAEVLSGGAPMSGAAARHVLSALRDECLPLPSPVSDRGARPSRASVPPRLTDREREMLDLLARGLRYQEVAGVVGLSINTVRAHVRAIYGKLDVTSRAEAIMVAHEGGQLST